MNFQNWLWVVGLLLLLGLGACAPSRYVKPLDTGQVAVTGHLGGPLFTSFGPPIPVPLTSVAVGYGLREHTTAFGGLHLTSLAFANIQLDAGVTRSLMQPAGWRPGISVSPTANFIVGLRAGAVRFWPSIDANAWWEYGDRGSYLYAGGHTWIEWARLRSHGAEQPQALLPGLQLGHVWQGNRWGLTSELKWANAAAVNTDGTVDWAGIGQRGSVGVFLGITKWLGK